MPTSNSNAEDVDEVHPLDNDWVVIDVRTAYSKYMTIASLRVLLDFQDIVEPSIPEGVALRFSIPQLGVVVDRFLFHVRLCNEGLLCPYTI